MTFDENITVKVQETETWDCEFEQMEWGRFLLYVMFRTAV